MTKPCKLSSFIIMNSPPIFLIYPQSSPGWRDELLPVVASWCGEPVLLMERAAVPYFGMKAYGVHINGYVKDPVTNEILLWVAKRSRTKSTFPGILLLKSISSLLYNLFDLLSSSRTVLLYYFLVYFFVIFDHQFLDVTMCYRLCIVLNFPSFIIYI